MGVIKNAIQQLPPVLKDRFFISTQDLGTGGFLESYYPTDMYMGN